MHHVRYTIFHPQMDKYTVLYTLGYALIEVRIWASSLGIRRFVVAPLEHHNSSNQYKYYFLKTKIW